MRRLPIALQLGSMFAVTILLLIAVLGYSVYQFDTNAKEYNDLVHHTNARTLNLKTAETNFETGLASLRGFLLYADSANEQGVKGALSTSTNIVKQFAEGTRAKQVKQNAEKLQSQLEEYIGLSEKIITAKRNNDPSLASLIAETRPKTETVRKQFEATLAGQAETLKKRTDAIEAHQRSIENIVLYSSLTITLIVISLVIWYCCNLAKRMNTLRGELVAVSDLDLTRKDVHATRNDEIGDMAEAVITMKQALRSVVGQVRSSADTLAASSEELTSTVEEQLRTSEVIAKTTGDIAAGSAQNTNNITDISAVIEEVNAGAEEMSATGAEVNNTTQNAVADAKHGMQLIQKVVSQNETIEKSMKEIMDVSSSLVKGSAEIQEIITVISNIAGQTNLLALNAAIEAARAGEAGRGFAVVADEVRKLAEQSADATNHIGEIIKKMTGDIDFSVNAVNKANTEVATGKMATADTAKGFDAIVKKLEQVQSGIEQISHAVEETAKGMQSVVNNIQNISAVAQETSAGTQTVAAASEEQNASLHEVTSSAEALAKMATDLNVIIQKFKM